jgi:hypothetical protein
VREAVAFGWLVVMVRGHENPKEGTASFLKKRSEKLLPNLSLA